MLSSLLCKSIICIILTCIVYACVLMVMVNMCLSVIGLWLPTPNKPATLGKVGPDQTTGREGVCRRQEESRSGGI